MRNQNMPALLLGLALALALAACGDEGTAPPRDATPPVLEILAPTAADSVLFAGPVLVRARCQEDDGRGCTVEVFLGGARVALGADSVNATVSLAQHGDQSLRLSFVATNASGGKTTAETAELRVASTRWVEVVTVPQRLVDASPDFALYRDSDFMMLLDVRTGASRSIGATTLWSSPNLVTATGAIISYALGHGLNKPTGVRLSGGTTEGDVFGHEASARGRFAAWHSVVSLKVHRDDVVGKSISETPDSLQVATYHLAENGAVALIARRPLDSQRVYLWEGIDIRRVSPDSAAITLAPVTDGTGVVYGQSIPVAGGREYRLVRQGAVGAEEVLATIAAQLPAGAGYAVNNGWTAYHVPGVTGAYRLWIRTPSGERREVLPGSAPFRLRSLGPAGQLVLADAATGQLLLVDPPHTRATVITAGNLDALKWIGGQLYRMTDRTLFRLERAGS